MAMIVVINTDADGFFFFFFEELRCWLERLEMMENKYLNVYYIRFYF